MWIDFERRYGVFAGSFFGRQAWMFGADGEGEEGTGGRTVRYDRRRRALAALWAMRQR